MRGQLSLLLRNPKVPQRSYTLDELKLNGIDTTSLLSPVDTTLGSIERNLQIAAVLGCLSAWNVFGFDPQRILYFSLGLLFLCTVDLHEVGQFLIAYLVGILPKKHSEQELLRSIFNLSGRGKKVICASGDRETSDCWFSDHFLLQPHKGLHFLCDFYTILSEDSSELHMASSKMVVPLNTWVLISNFKLAYNLLRHPDGTFNRHLAEFLERKVPANANPVDGVFSFDVIIDRETSLLSRIYRPADAEEHFNFGELEKPVDSEVVPVIVFFHGGSFVHSSSNSAIYDTLCRRLVGSCKAVVVSVNYRRAPENRYPCAYDDGWTALKWVSSRTWLQSKKDSKVHIFLAGDSSGGNMVHHVALKAVESRIEVLGDILLNPMFGGEERKESEKQLDGKYFVSVRDRDWYWRAFLPEGEDRDHPACNPFGPKGKSLVGQNFPKSLVVVAGLDLIRDWQLAYADGLKEAGQEVKLLYLEKATIGFYLLPNNAHFYTVMDEITKFVCPDC